MPPPQDRLTRASDRQRRAEDVVVRAALESGQDVLLIDGRFRHEDHGQPGRVLLKEPAEGVAVEPGHLHIGNHEGWHRLSGQNQGLGAAVGGHHAVAVAAEVFGQDTADRTVIVDDKDLLAH